MVVRLFSRSPLPSLDDLPEDIYKLLGGKLQGDQIILDQFGPRLSEILNERLRSKSEDRVPTLRMSNIGRPLRQLWYEINGYKPEEIDGKTHFKFLYGDIIECLVLVLAEAAGHEVKRLQEEIEVDGIKGHIDAVIDGELVDVKSASPFGYRKFSDGSLFSNDTFGYTGQISGYAHALQLPARFIAINKVLGDICTLSVSQETINAYDVTRRIKTVREAVGSPDAPPRCYVDEPDGKSGNRVLSTGCNYCGWKKECWKDSNDGRGLRVFLYSDGPRYFTSITREPKVFELNNKE